MTCESCGDKPHKCGNCNKDFPKAVVEINNPETITMLRKVVIPISMGDEEQVPPAVGKYHNVLLYYEANKHIYIYSSDGIPTLIESEIPQDLIDRVATLEDDMDDLQEEFEEFKNSPDVVDIVSTYADLEAYDTSELGDKDVIRVLQDETHDGSSSYYRWDKPNEQWVFIGITGPYYTKGETDALIEAARKTWVGDETTSSASGSTAEITTTSGDFEWDEGHTVTINFAYKANRSSLKIDSESAYDIDNVRSLSGGIDAGTAIQYTCVKINNRKMYRPIGRLRASSDVAGPVFIEDNLTTTGSQLKALSANQGKVLKDSLDALDEKVDTLVGTAKVLSSEDYNWNSVSHNTTAPYDSVALWLLPPGLYVSPSNVAGYVGYNTDANIWQATSDLKLYQITPQGTYGVTIIAWEKQVPSGSTPFQAAVIYCVLKTNNASNGHISGRCILAAPIDNLSGYALSEVPLSAKQGAVLSGKIGTIDTLTTTNKTSLVSALNEVNAKEDYIILSERDTETKWVDSSNIYKTTISVGALPNNSSQMFTTGAGVKEVVRLEIIAHDANNGVFVHIPDGVGATASAQGGNVTITTTADYSGYSAYITIWYTKND